MTERIFDLGTIKMIIRPESRPINGNGLNHTEFFELIIQDELLVRKERRIKAAMFRESKTLDDLDRQLNPSIKKNQICDLANCRFIRECQDWSTRWAELRPRNPGR